MMRRRTVALAGGVACIALITAACGSSGPKSGSKATGAASSGGGGGGVVKLVFQQFDPPDQAKGLQAAVDNWNKTHANIQVTMRNVPFKEALNTYVREAGTGSGADILHTAFTWSADLAKNSEIVNLDKFVKSSPPSNGLQDFVGQKITTYNGSTYSVPFTADSFGLTYNPANFKAAGITNPPKTWDDLLADAGKLTTGSGADKTYGLCFAAASGPTSEIWHTANVYLWSNGGTLVTQKNGAWTTGTPDSLMAQAISYLGQFFTKGYTPKSMLSVALGGDPTITTGLAKGTCAMAMEEPTEFAVALQSNPNLRSAPLPAGSAGNVEQMGGRALSINPNCKHQEEAWEFIRYLVSAEDFQKYYTNQFPAQKTLLSKNQFGPTLATPAYAGFAKSITMAQTYYQYSESPAAVPVIWAAVAQNFGGAFAGQASPEQAASNLNKQLATALKGK